MHAAANPIRVLIASDDRLFAHAIKLAVEREGEADVAVKTCAARDVAAAAEATPADVAVIAGCESDGLSSRLRLLRERTPCCRTLLLVDVGDEKTLIEALESGASGFFTRAQSVSEFADAIRMVHRGETYVPPEMLGTLVGELIRRGKDRTDALRRTGRLTRREREVLALLARGADTAGIAAALVISPETARTHIQHVLCKLDVHSRLQAATLVTEAGILEELEAESR